MLFLLPLAYFAVTASAASSHAARHTSVTRAVFAQCAGIFFLYKISYIPSTRTMMGSTADYDIGCCIDAVTHRHYFMGASARARCL